MNIKKEFKNLYSNYSKKCYLYNAGKAMLVDFLVCSILLITFWIINFKYYWIGFIVGVLLLIPFFILFNKLSGPNDLDFINYVEKANINQKAITMYEFKDEESLIINRQREDAKITLNSIDAKNLKYKSFYKIIAISKDEIINKIIYIKQNKSPGNNLDLNY